MVGWKLKMFLIILTYQCLLILSCINPILKSWDVAAPNHLQKGEATNPEAKPDYM